MPRRPGIARPTDAGQVMTVDQVAAYLQINRLTVYRYVREGWLPAARIGKVYRILRADVDRFLEARRVPPPQAVRPVQAPPRADRRDDAHRDEAPSRERIRSVWVRDFKSPTEIYVGPNRIESRPGEKPMFRDVDLMAVVVRGFN